MVFTMDPFQLTAAIAYRYTWIAVTSELGQLTANQRFRHSDLETDFVTVI